MNQIMIQADHISFQYDSLPVLTDISFSVQKGEFISLIGSNGSGKTTLLRLLLGELPLQQGSIMIMGKPIGHFTQWPRIGYVPQQGFSMPKNFPATVQEVVRSNLYKDIGLFHWAKKQHEEKVRQALAVVGMEHCLHSRIGELSGGQQQRVFLARVLVNEPELVLLDEPTTGIDQESIQLFYELLHQLNRDRGMTILMVTHDLAGGLDYVSRILCIEKGTMVELTTEQARHEVSHRHKHA